VDDWNALVSQGRILKHGGDAVAAAALADEARTMDLADRFLNSESVKRMLQAGTYLNVCKRDITH
jgi:hypothetical protein